MAQERTGSLPRAARLLRAIARGAGAGASLMELVSWTGLPRPTIHRVLADLEALGWVERDAATRRWHLGRDVLALGLTAGLRHPIARIAETEAARLVAATGLAAFVMIRSGNDAVCVLRQEREAGRQRLFHEVGGRAPLGLGAGSMALLAAMPLAEAAAVLAANRPRYRRLETYDERAFRGALDEARRTGVAMHVDLFVPGLTGIGVAVRGPGGHQLAALSIACPTRELDARRRPATVRALERAAATIGAQIAPALPGDGAAEET